ncbi:MAG TPA: glutamate--tRNA ligase [Candidatus Paceibacterota bacterium]|nr:glutamate--tRNA ligase [Candidatus Paceibacterota bacterium]HOQ15602.1 glutamate--tRNA ligase [Candidatus Paceibacterota bacterium]HPQ23136.1 glutamate--tRNA ligase [Candidatus Paceibacterota bacterium]HRR45920.1 glutamate--tRNA ligase [Candidatus Paceibacterota bacterium]
MTPDPSTPQSLFGPRLRIAPSPTGFLHVGTARTALFNFLLARKTGGKFILRIEDTDKERSKKEFEQSIFDGLKWLGLSWDEGPDIGGPFGPYRQSERIDLYQKYLEQLLAEDKAYFCFCSPEDLEAQKRDLISQGKVPVYSGRCRYLSKEEIKKNLSDNKPYVIRLKMPSSKIKFKDLIRGEIEFDLNLIGDIIIAKNLKEPLYNFVVVVDDYLMKINYVIRGEDHISNTPKQIVLQEMLGFDKVNYAHLPMILGPDKSKLSKRHGATNLIDYQKQGYLSEAMINFLALLGWHPHQEQEIFSLDELIEQFSLERVQKAGAIFNINKLNWFNNFYLKNLPFEEVEKRFLDYLKTSPFQSEIKKYPLEYFIKVLKIELPRINKFEDLFIQSDFFFKEEIDYPKELLIWKSADFNDIIKALEDSLNLLKEIEEKEMTALNLQSKFMLFIEGNDLYKNDRGKILWPLRVALSGKKASPPPFEIIEIIGKERAIKRIEKAIQLVSNNNDY